MQDLFAKLRLQLRCVMVHLTAKHRGAAEWVACRGKVDTERSSVDCSMFGGGQFDTERRKERPVDVVSTTRVTKYHAAACQYARHGDWRSCHCICMPAGGAALTGAAEAGSRRKAQVLTPQSLPHVCRLARLHKELQKLGVCARSFYLLSCAWARKRTSYFFMT